MLITLVYPSLKWNFDGMKKYSFHSYTLYLIKYIKNSQVCRLLSEECIGFTMMCFFIFIYYGFCVRLNRKKKKESFRPTNFGRVDLVFL